MSVSPYDCANEILETVPLVMRTIRSQMRRHRGPGLSVPQFRVLAFLNRNEGSSLTDLADHMGLTLPSTSTLVEGLVERRLLHRRVHPADRRRVTLALSAEGRSVFKAARSETQESLARTLSRLPPNRRTELIQAMQDLKSLFPGGSASPLSEGEGG